MLFCSGKVYYDLLKARHAADAYDVAVVRIEQLAPFPFGRVRDELLRYPNAEVSRYLFFVAFSAVFISFLSVGVIHILWLSREHKGTQRRLS